MLGGEGDGITRQDPMPDTGEALQPPTAGEAAERRMSASDFWALIDPEPEAKPAPIRS